MIALGRLGLGTAPIGGLYEAVEDETAHALVERAWALGLRYFDTAVQFPQRHPAVATVIVGCRTAEEVAENMRPSTLEIPDALWDELA